MAPPASAPPASAPIGWLGIARLGLVQAALGSIVVLMTSTLNRVMVVELALPAIIPGVLVALHYAVQVLRPRLGYGSDVGGRRTPWIVGGMAALALGGAGAASATALMAVSLAAGLALALLAYTLVGLGVGAAGTALLTLLAKRVSPSQRGPAATVVWIMMIAGIVVTSVAAGKLLDPFSTGRLIAVISGVSLLGLAVSVLAVWGMEGEAAPVQATRAAARQPFVAALRDVWAEPQARRFAVFVFVSMLAYSAQELVLEPFAGAVFALTPGRSTGLTGMHHAGVLAGMGLVALGGVLGIGAMRTWTMGGCLGSAVAALALAACALGGPEWAMRVAVVLLGVGNGAFAVSAIGAMMGLASQGRAAREGTRMGLWGAAQALAFGAGGLLGTGASDLARAALGAPAPAYAAVFVGEAAVFLLAARLAAGVFGRVARAPSGAVQAA
ncbi:MAG TPA: BCD family MFS transporter [Acetobacteraceae bacterium]